jgi:hypothetical protein
MIQVADADVNITVADPFKGTVWDVQRWHLFYPPDSKAMINPAAQIDCLQRKWPKFDNPDTHDGRKSK